MTTRPHALPSTFQILARPVAVTPLSPFTPPLGSLYLSSPHARPPPSPPPLPLSPPHPPQIPLHNFLTAIAPPTLLRNIHDMGLQHFPRQNLNFHWPRLSLPPLSLHQQQTPQIPLTQTNPNRFPFRFQFPFPFRLF